MENNDLGKIKNAHYSMADYRPSQIPEDVKYEILLKSPLFKASDRQYENYDNEKIIIDKNEDYFEPMVIYFLEDNVICCWDDFITHDITNEFLKEFTNKIKNIIYKK
jgi:hypothetical protein